MKYIRLLILLLCVQTLFAASKPKLIVIDPGHGGKEKGARISSPFCEEKTLSLITANYIRSFLEKKGYKVLLTRSSDMFVSLNKRVDIANKARADLFISMHFNSSINKSANGIEVFYCNNIINKPRVFSSYNLSKNLLDSIVSKTKLHSRGIKKSNFYVIKNTKMPAVLIEGGFLTNPKEREIVRNQEYLKELAKSISEGIDKYFSIKKW